MVAIPIEVPDLIAEDTGKPDHTAIAMALRGERQWSPEARAWLAELFDPDCGSEWTARVEPRTPSIGRPKSPLLRHTEAFVFFEKRWAQIGAKGRKKALGEACDKFKLGSSTLEAAISAHESARRLHAEIDDGAHGEWFYLTPLSNDSDKLA